MKRIIILFSFLLLILPLNVNALLKGIDVSEFQGDIDFEKVKNDGIEIVYIRSSYGSSGVDSKYRKNYQNAKKYGLKIGFYHFLTARNIEEAKEEARFFSHIISGTTPECRLAIDFEVLRGLSKIEINNITKSFLEEVEKLTNKQMIIYSDAINASRVFDGNLAKKYPLWIAEYDVDEPEIDVWKDWTGWQYTDRGKVLGINGYVDKDYFKEEILLNDVSQIKEPKLKDEEKLKTVYHKTRVKDTLSKIANEYKTTVEEIKKSNNLKSDKIKPNQILKIKTDYRYETSNENKIRVYVVKKGDNLSKIAKIFNSTVYDLVMWNNILNPNLIYPGETLYIPPKDYSTKYSIIKSIPSYYKFETYDIIIHDLFLIKYIIY